MIDSLATLMNIGTATLFTGFLVFLRVGAAMAVLPVVGERTVPERVRLALALAFTTIVAPAVQNKIPGGDLQAAQVATLLFTETAAGLVIGISLRLFIIALQTAGSIAAQSTSLSQIFGSAAADPQPAIGHLLVIAGLALAVSAGLHVQIAAMFIYSYEIMVPGTFIPANGLAEWGVAQAARMFALAFSLAAPFAIASLVYNVALGAINRAMPQLMVSFVGAPAITAGGLILLMIAAPLILSVWLASLHGFFVDPFGIPK